jgi:hypothetical protein
MASDFLEFDILCKNKNMKCLLDSGADMSVMKHSLFSKMFKNNNKFINKTHRI